MGEQNKKYKPITNADVIEMTTTATLFIGVKNRISTTNSKFRKE